MKVFELLEGGDMKRPAAARFLALSVLALTFVGPQRAIVHCDGMDGPVVKASQRALAKGDVNLVLIWVQANDEAEIRKVFAKTMAVRKLNAEARELADLYFFETLVRIHRAGEGAPYTGLKPAGRDLGPAIPAADRAVESGGTAALETLLVKEMRTGVGEAFGRVQAKRKYDANDVAAGREYVKAYVEYIHFVERLHEATTRPAAGHYAETESN